MEYFSINFYPTGEKRNWIWIERKMAENGEEAERLLARNNPQLILNEEEFKQLFGQMATELELRKIWVSGSLEKLYPYPCADFRIEKLDEKVTYLHIRVPLSQKTAQEDFEKCTSG